MGNGSGAKKKYLIPAALILLGAAVQNRFFDELFPVAGMDAVSLSLSLVLFFCFFAALVDRGGKMDWREVLLTAYLGALCLFGILSAGVNSVFLLRFRTSFYFVSTYVIFSSLKLDETTVIRLYRYAGITTAAVCLFFYKQNVDIYGIRFRDVSMNLYFCSFAVILGLFVELRGENRWLKYAMVLVCVMAIVTSQQRSQIIPLSAALGVYVLTNIGLDIRRAIKMLVFGVCCYFTYRFLDDIGILDLVFNRLEATTSEESTLWMRTDAASVSLSEFGMIQWLFGTGLTGMVELELFVPNYIYKYGIIGSMLIVGTTAVPAINAALKRRRCFSRMMVIGLALMFIGGFISGFGGQNGQLLIASILAFAASPRIAAAPEGMITYRLPLVTGPLKKNHSKKDGGY